RNRRSARHTGAAAPNPTTQCTAHGDRNSERDRPADDTGDVPAHPRRPSRRDAAMSERQGYWTTLAARFGEGWNRFWFTPSDPLSLGVLRIGIGLILFFL